MSPAHIGGPSGPFIEAVSAAALTATAMLFAAALLNGTDFAAPPPIVLFPFALAAAALVVALSAALIGLPLTWLLARRRREAAWTYPAAGLVAGAAIMAGLLGIDPSGGSHSVAEWLQMASLGAAPGFVCGASWWFLYRRHFQSGDSG